MRFIHQTGRSTRSLRRSIASTRLETVTVKADIEAATYAGLGVVGFVSSAGVRSRFARLPADEFDIGHLDGLKPACFAMLYATAEARAAGVLEVEGRLPVAIAAEAAEVERRMQTLCEYLFGDDPEIRPELDRLRVARYARCRRVEVSLHIRTFRGGSRRVGARGHRPARRPVAGGGRLTRPRWASPSSSAEWSP